MFASWRSLAHLRWYGAPIALVSEAVSFVALWQLNRIALHVSSWFVVACSQLSGNAVGRIVPGCAATANAFAIGMLRRAGVDVGESATALAASTLLQLGAALGLPVLALPAIVAGAPVDRSLATSTYLGAAVLVLLVGAGVLAFAFDRPLELAGEALEWVLNRTIGRHRKVTDLPQRLLAERNLVRQTIGGNWQGAWSRPQAARPLVATLTLAGVDAQDAVLATFTYRLVSCWLPIPAGGAAYVAFRRGYG